jgi:hypothetical protein
MRLPKAGIKIDDLLCKHCGKTLAEIKALNPSGKIACEQQTCPQKLPQQGE